MMDSFYTLFTVFPTTVLLNPFDTLTRYDLTEDTTKNQAENPVSVSSLYLSFSYSSLLCIYIYYTNQLQLILHDQKNAESSASQHNQFFHSFFVLILLFHLELD